MTSTKQTTPITTIEDAATSRWLTKTLVNARAHAQEVPAEAALERIRMRVFGEPVSIRRKRRLAA